MLLARNRFATGLHTINRGRFQRFTSTRASIFSQYTPEQLSSPKVPMIPYEGNRGGMTVINDEPNISFIITKEADVKDTNEYKANKNFTTKEEIAKE